MTYKAKIDKQGRILVPAEYRKKLNFSVNTILELSIVANQLIIRKKSSINDEFIVNWKKKIKSLNLKPNTEVQNDFEEKWMSEDYAREKLGL